MAKILLVEDDVQLSGIVAEALEKEGHKVESCCTKSEAEETLEAGAFDLMVFDVSLPDGNGFDLCREYRKRGGIVPIIMLTGKAGERDKISGLDSGADDYLTKPFGLRELTARLRALLRRPQTYVPEMIEICDLKLDVTSRKVFKGDKELRLQPLDYALLEFFVKNPNQVLSQETILRRVWDSYTESGVEALRAAVKRIRKEIDDDGKESLIETIYKAGYAFRPGR